MLWNDLLTIIISILSLIADISITLIVLSLYKKNKARSRQATDNVKLLKLVKGSVKEEDLLVHCGNLDQREKQILIMYFCQDKNLYDIADTLYLSVDHVKKLKSVAIAKMN